MCLWNSCRSESGKVCPGLQNITGRTTTSIEKIWVRDEHWNLFHVHVAVSGFTFRRRGTLIDLYGIFFTTVVANPQNPPALSFHILDEDIFPIPLARYPHGNGNVGLADGVCGNQQLLRERVPLLEVLDLLLGKIEGRVGLLQHVLQALVGRLAGLETEVAYDLVLHLGGELPKGGRRDVQISGLHLLDERAQLFLGGQSWVGDDGPRRLCDALPEVDFGQSIRVVVVPAVLGLGERGGTWWRRCRRVVVLSARRFGSLGRLGRRVSHQVLQIHRILIYHDWPSSNLLSLPFRRFGLLRSAKGI